MGRLHPSLGAHRFILGLVQGVCGYLWEWGLIFRYFQPINALWNFGDQKKKKKKLTEFFTTIARPSQLTINV